MSLLKESLIYGLSDFLSKGINILLFPVFAHFFSVEDYGLLGMITIISTLSTLIVEFGIGNSIQLLYFDTQYQDSKKEIVSTGFFLQVIIGIIITILMLVLGYVLRDKYLTPNKISFSLFTIAVLLGQFSLYFRYVLNILRLHFNPIPFAIFSFLGNVSWMLFSLWYFKMYNANMSMYLLSNLIVLALMLPFLLFSIKKDLTLLINKEHAKVILKLGSPFIISNIAFWLFSSIDRTILVKYGSLYDVGIYTTAFKFAALINIIHAAFSQSWAPNMFKTLYAQQTPDTSFIEVISKNYLLFLGVIAILIVFFLPEVYYFLTPKEYWNAIVPTGIIILALFINSAALFSNIGLNYKKKVNIVNSINIVMMLCNAIVAFVCIYFFKAIGASIALVITYLMWLLVNNFYSKKYYPYSFNLLKHLPIFVSYIAVLFFSYFTKNIHYANFNLLFFLGKIVCIILPILIFNKRIISILKSYYEGSIIK